MYTLHLIQFDLQTLTTTHDFDKTTYSAQSFANTIDCRQSFHLGQNSRIELVVVVIAIVAAYSAIVA